MCPVELATYTISWIFSVAGAIAKALRAMQWNDTKTSLTINYLPYLHEKKR